MVAAFITLLPVFVTMGLGYLLGRTNVIAPSSSKVFSALVLNVAMPAYLLVRISTMPDFSSIPLSYLVAFIIVQISIGLGVLFALKQRHCNASELVLGTMGSCYTNSAFMGIPISILLFGSALPILIITAYQLTFLTTIILCAHEFIKNKNEKQISNLTQVVVFLKTIILNPIISASILGFIIAKSGYTIPGSIQNILEFIGSPSVPLALFALGLSLSNKEYDKHSRNHDVYFIVFIKNILHPATAFLVGKYIFHLPVEWLGPLVVASALPTATNNYIFAEKYGHFRAESRDVVFYTSIFSLPIIAIIFTMFS